MAAFEAASRGLEFFRSHLMTEEGAPRAVSDGAVSVDGQNVAQCVQTLAVCSNQPSDWENAGYLWHQANERCRETSRPLPPMDAWPIGCSPLLTL